MNRLRSQGRMYDNLGKRSSWINCYTQHLLFHFGFIDANIMAYLHLHSVKIGTERNTHTYTYSFNICTETKLKIKAKKKYAENNNLMNALIRICGIATFKRNGIYCVSWLNWHVAEID